MTTVIGDECAAPGMPIAVMLASHRDALLATWLPRLSLEKSFDVQGGPVTDPACIRGELERRKPRVLLLDKALFERLDAPPPRLIREASPAVRVLLLADEHCTNLAGEVLANRFHGLLLADSPAELSLKAIRAVAQGEIWLPRTSLVEALAKLQRWPGTGDARLKNDAAAETRSLGALTVRETEILSLVRRGCTNKQVARHLGIMEDTVKKHLQSIFTKLGVRRRTLVVLGGTNGEAASP